MNKTISSPTLPRVPKYQELAERLRQQIASEELKPGHQLPSFAQMNAEYGIGQSTLERVYTLLERDGLIVRDPGRGTFVSESNPLGEVTGLIAVIAPHSIYKHPYYAQLLQGVQQSAREIGLDILLLHDASGIQKKKVDGLIIHASKQETLLKFLPPGIPRVSAVYPQEGMSSVCADDSQGTKDAVHYLFSQGHRRIAFLTEGCARQADALSKQRYAAYCEAMQEVGIELKPRWVRYLYDPWTSTNRGAKASFMTHGRQKMLEWLQEDWAALECTALLCQNDDTAIGVIEALQERGYKVPQDVSVIGFDGTEVAEYFRPRLTTVHVPLREIGEKSVQLLQELVETPAASRGGQSRSILIPTYLQIGDSTTALN